jgi:hypothetical protein
VPSFEAIPHSGLMAAIEERIVEDAKFLCFLVWQEVWRLAGGCS